MNTNATNQILLQVTNTADTLKPANQRQAFWHMLTKPVFDLVEINGISKWWVGVFLIVAVTIIISIITSRIGNKDYKPDKQDIFLFIVVVILILFFLVMAIFDQIKRFSK